MKLLLTSGGITNESIAKALEDLAGKPRSEIKIAFIPTAAFSEEGADEAKEWLVNDMYRIKEFCGSVDIVSLADLSKEQLLRRLQQADVIFVGGGNTFYLSYWMDKSGLFDALPELLKTRVYAGISAGSMIATPSIRTASQAIKNPDLFHDAEYDELGPKGRSSARTANLVNFVFRPHLNSRDFSNIRPNFLEETAKDIGLPMYALDDQSALKIDGDNIEVVSEGEWKLYE